MNCTRPSCGKRGIWRPELALRSTAKGPETLASFSDIILCEEHKETTHLPQLLSDTGWERIARHLREAGKPAPRKHLTILRYALTEPPESAEAESLPF
jgi:hypothetical protein